MALQVKKAEPIGDLVIGKAPQQKLTVSRATPQGKLSVGPAQQNMTISGVSGARPNPLAVMAQRTNPMNNPLKWFGETAVEFASGVADMLNPVSAFTGISKTLAERLSLDSDAAFEARQSQTRLDEQNIELLQRAATKIKDPRTSPEERQRWQNFVRSQGHLMATNQFTDVTAPNDELMESMDPLVGVANTLGTVFAGGEAKAGIKAGEDIFAAIAKSDVKKEALDYLVRQATVGRTDIPVHGAPGRPKDPNVHVRTVHNIPVRYEPSDEVLDQRLSREVDIMSGRHVNELHAAENSDAPLLNTMATDTKYNQVYNDLLAQRDGGTLPQRIEVQDGNAPKSGRKAQQLGDPNEIKTPEQIKAEKIKRARDDAISGNAEFKKAPKADPAVKAKPEKKELPQLAKDIDEALANGNPVKVKDPGLAHRLFGSIANYLERSGQGGKLINRGVQRARDYNMSKSESTLLDLERAGLKAGMDDNRIANIAKAIKAGDGSGLDADDRKLAAALVRAFRDVRKEAGKAGAKMGDQKDNYFPEWYKKDDENMVQMFNQTFNKKQGFEKVKKAEGEDYEKTAEAIVRYFETAYHRIGLIKEFGQNDENLEAMLKLAAKELDHDHFERLSRYTRQALGTEPVDKSGMGAIARGARKYEAYTSLQRSALANLGQPTNTATVAGVARTLKGYYKLLSDGNTREYARRVGAYGDSILATRQETFAGASGRSFSKHASVRFFKKHVAVPAMQAVEKANRAHAAVVGADFAEHLVKQAAQGNKLAIRQLEKYFPDLKPGQTLTPEDLGRASRNFVKETQFLTDPVDLPAWATKTEWGRLIFQLRSFGYRQTKFMVHHVLSEAKAGNFRPLTRFLAVGVPVGAGIGALKDKAVDVVSDVISPGEDTDAEKEKAERPLWQVAFDGFAQVGGGGLVLSEAQNVFNNIKYNGKEPVSSVLENTAGPAIGDVWRAAGALDKGINGDWSKSIQLAASQIPIVGPVTADLAKKWTQGETKDITKMNPDELDKFKSTTYAKFLDGMNDKDKDLMAAVNDEDYARIGIKSGKFTQDQIDEMQAKYNRNLFTAGLPIKYIKGVTDEEFETFSDELKGLVMEASMVGIKKFAESDKYDKTAEAVMTKAMESAWPEVGEIKGNNQLALDYLKAQRDHTEAAGDDGKQFDIVKGFWTKAVKAQYSDKVKNLYGNSLADIKRLYEGITVNGVKYEISREDMDAAVALDDRLLAAGLKDTPKFSNKTRAAYGYGEAPTSKVDGVGYAGKKTSGSGRGGSGRQAANPYGKTITRGSRSSLRGTSGASSSGGRASVKLAGATGGGNTAKPRVSRTKNKV